MPQKEISTSASNNKVYFSRGANVNILLTTSSFSSLTFFFSKHLAHTRIHRHILFLIKMHYHEVLQVKYSGLLVILWDCGELFEAKELPKDHMLQFYKNKCIISLEPNL